MKKLIAEYNIIKNEVDEYHKTVDESLIEKFGFTGAEWRKKLSELYNTGKSDEYQDLRKSVTEFIETNFSDIEEIEDKLIKKFTPFYNEFIINLENRKECRYEDNIFIIWRSRYL